MIPFIYKTNHLMLSAGIMAVYFKNYKKSINTLRGQTVEFSMSK